MNEPKISNAAMFEYLTSLKPTAAPASQEFKDWWDKTGLPTLREQALSELRRNDEMPPRLIGFMKGGTMGVINVADATKGMFGSVASKNATAFIHKIAAMIPGTQASVFCVEAWALQGRGKEAFDRQREKYPNLGDHPDRYEVVMFQALHYNNENNTMEQLSTMIEVIKVLGVNRSRKAWADTKFGEVVTTDPMGDGELKMSGRFVFGNPGDDE